MPEYLDEFEFEPCFSGECAHTEEGRMAAYLRETLHPESQAYDEARRAELRSKTGEVAELAKLQAKRSAETAKRRCVSSLDKTLAVHDARVPELLLRCAWKTRFTEIQTIKRRASAERALAAPPWARIAWLETAPPIPGTTLGTGAERCDQPPFNRAAEFWEHAVNPIPGKVALLLRLAWLEGQDRGAMFKWVPLSRVWVFSGRLPMMHRVGYDGPKSTSTIPHAWFVFDPEHIGPWTGGWL
jgi:hypothetical protein